MTEEAIQTSDEDYKGWTISRRGVYRRQLTRDDQAVMVNHPRMAHAYIDAAEEEAAADKAKAKK